MDIEPVADFLPAFAQDAETADFMQRFAFLHAEIHFMVADDRKAPLRGKPFEQLRHRLLTPPRAVQKIACVQQKIRLGLFN